METLFRYVPFLFKKLISVSFRFGKIAVFRFVLFLLDIVSFRFHSVSEKYGECSGSLRSVSNRSFSNQFRFVRSVPFKCTGLSVSDRFVPFQSVPIRSVSRQYLYRFLFPSVPFHKFCLSCCSDATCHIQHS